MLKQSLIFGLNTDELLYSDVWPCDDCAKKIVMFDPYASREGSAMARILRVRL